MSGLLSAWLAEVVLIAYRSAKASDPSKPIPGLAMPSEYVSTMIVYGALAFVPAEGQHFAAAVGWGLVVATFLNLWTPGKVVNGKQQPPGVSVTKPANTATARNVDTGLQQQGA